MSTTHDEVVLGLPYFMSFSFDEGHDYEHGPHDSPGQTVREHLAEARRWFDARLGGAELQAVRVGCEMNWVKAACGELRLALELQPTDGTRETWSFCLFGGSDEDEELGGDAAFMAALADREPGSEASPRDFEQALLRVVGSGLGLDEAHGLVLVGEGRVAMVERDSEGAPLAGLEWRRS